MATRRETEREKVRPGMNAGAIFRTLSLAGCGRVADNVGHGAFALRGHGHWGMGGMTAVTPREPGQAEKWLAEARDGSPEAFGRLLQHCRGYLLHIAADRIDPHWRAKVSASDLVQDFEE